MKSIFLKGTRYGFVTRRVTKDRKRDMKEEQIKTEKTTPLETFVTLRLRPEEKAELQARAEDSGCTISQFIRKVMLRKMPVPSGRIAPSESERNLALSLKTLASAHKKTAENYTEITNSCMKLITEMRREFPSSVQVKTLSRNLFAVVDETMNMQRALNEVLVLRGAKDKHLYAKPGGFSELEGFMGTTESQRESDNIRLMNIEYVRVTGKVVEDHCVVTKDAAGTELFTFKFDAEEFAGGKVEKTRYNVVFPAEGRNISSYCKGDFLVLCGAVRHDADGGLLLKADFALNPMKIKNTDEDMRSITIVGKLAEDAKVSKRQNGSEEMSFVMTVEDYFKGGKTSIPYKVSATKTRVVDYLVKGRMVVVSGNVRRDSSTGMDCVYTENIELMPDRR